MSTLDLNQALEHATRIAKAAGDMIAERSKEIRPEDAGRSMGVETKSTPNDLVTDVDHASQELIISNIREHYPEHRFIAEEEGADDLGDKDSPYAWIIDPLDGTVPFIHGRDNFGVIIALQKDDEVILGVIYMPLKNELFTAIRGQGAFFNGNPVTLRNTQNMHDAILCSNTVRRAHEVDGVLMLSTPKCASLENYGSAVQEFSEMLKGCNDGSFFLGIRLWDIAAGCMMVEEAGGKSFYEFLEPGNVRGGLRVVSSTVPIYDELKSFVDKNL